MSTPRGGAAAAGAAASRGGTGASVASRLAAMREKLGAALAAGGIGAAGGSGGGLAASALRKRVAALAAGVAGAAGAFLTQRGVCAPTWLKSATPEDCGAACDALLASVVKTRYKTGWTAGLYTIELSSPRAGAPVLVLLHGYGSGSGLWAFNLDALAKHYHVYAVDWLGCGASERPLFPAAESVAQGERWFTESLEAWRAARGIDRAVWVGHSLGGYLTAAYALHHPRRVEQLVLVSPAGIPTPPDPERLALQRSHWFMALLAWAWERNVTPQSIVRALGPLGERWATSIISRRFANMLDERHASLDRAAFVRYLYQITAAEGSGEFALNALLSFGAHARDPMGPRLARAAAVGEAPEPSDSGESGAVAPSPRRFIAPTTLFYGASHDWMPASAGVATAAAMRRVGVDAAVVLTPDSGHHLYLEQPDIFVAQLLARLREAGAAPRGSL